MDTQYDGVFPLAMKGAATSISGSKCDKHLGFVYTESVSL